MEDGEDQGAERHLLSERGEETNVHGGLLQRAHVVAARLHHQRERRLGGERHRHLPGVLGALAEPIPAERDSTLDLEEKRPRRLAPRRAQHDVRDGVAIGYALQRADGLLEIQRALVARGRRRRSGDVVPHHRRQGVLRRFHGSCRDLHRLGHDVGRKLAQDRVLGEGFQRLLFRLRRRRLDLSEHRRTRVNAMRRLP